MAPSSESVSELFQYSPEAHWYPELACVRAFLLSMVLITAGLGVELSGGGTAFEATSAKESADLRNSVTTFQNFQHDREVMLKGSAELVAYLPITRAIMTAHDPATIQDASKTCGN